MDNKRQTRHDDDGRKHPYQQCQDRKWDASAFVTDQCKCLGGGCTWHQLTKCIDIKQFLAGNIFAFLYKCFHHHPKMSLGSAECRNAVKENSPQKGYVTNQRQVLFFESDFSQTLIQVLSSCIILILLWILCGDTGIKTGKRHITFGMQEERQ